MSVPVDRAAKALIALSILIAPLGVTTRDADDAARDAFVAQAVAAVKKEQERK